jgi:hypothetical protein
VRAHERTGFVDNDQLVNAVVTDVWHNTSIPSHCVSYERRTSSFGPFRPFHTGARRRRRQDLHTGREHR